MEKNHSMIQVVALLVAAVSMANGAPGNEPGIPRGTGTAADYGGFEEAVEKIGAESFTLLITRPHRIEADLTVGGNLHLQFHRAGRLIVAEGATLTIHAAIDAGLWPILEGKGTINGRPAVTAVYPQWFGAVGDGETDDTAAIQRSIDFCRGAKNRCLLPPRPYRLTESLVLYGHNQHLEQLGSNRELSIRHGMGLIWDGPPEHAVIEVHRLSFSTIRGLTIFGERVGVLSTQDRKHAFLRS